MMAQGVDIDENEEEHSDEELPEEVLAAEREYKAKRDAERLNTDVGQVFSDGLGYAVVS